MVINGDGGNRMKINYGENVTLEVNISDKMMKDYAECQKIAACEGSGKECDDCGMNINIENTALCEMPVVTEELGKRALDSGMDKTTTEMMEHICDNLCRHPEKATDQDALEDICAECKMGKYVCDILNQYNQAIHIGGSRRGSAEDEANGSQG